MRAFILVPVAGRKSARSWLASRYCADVLVVASNPLMARHYANGALGVAIWSTTKDGPPPALPWTQEQLVDAHDVTKDLEDWDAPEGTVMLRTSARLDEPELMAA